MKTVSLRILIAAIAFVGSLATAYVVVWYGLGFNNSLSSENTIYSIRLGIIIGVLVAIGIGGLYLDGWRWRFVFWALATPPFLVGLLGLIQGGIADRFQGHQMLVFCGMMFCPMVGCTLGSIRLRRRQRAERSQNE